MALGRKTGGRQKGSRNKATTAKARQLADSGLMPLDWMLAVVRDGDAEIGRRDDMARAAAPFCHPRLASVQHSGSDGGPLVIEIIRFGKDTAPA